MKTLETDRLIIRNWQEDDAKDYFEIYKHPEVENAGAKICMHYDESLLIIHSLVKSHESGAIVLKENNKVIGSIFLCDVNRHDRYKEIEYIISKDYQNKGFATEAVKRLLKHAFTELDLFVVAVAHYPDNLKSKRVIEKCGFNYEGTLRMYSRNLKDSVRYSMTKDEWKQKDNIHY